MATDDTNLMQSGGKKVKYRVSRTGGWFMTMVALFLDFLPFIVLVGVVALLFVKMAGSGIVSGALSHDMRVMQESCEKSSGPEPSGALDKFLYAWNKNNCAGAKTSLGVTLGVVGFFGAFAGAWLFPFIFIVSTVVAALVAIILFPLWFYFGKHYVMVSFSNPNKVVVNVSSWIFTVILKLFPIINLFPVPVYALTISKHIQISREEDREKHKEEEKKRLAQEMQAKKRKRRQIESRGGDTRGQDRDIATLKNNMEDA